jgi:hypothetical protein
MRCQQVIRALVLRYRSKSHTYAGHLGVTSIQQTMCHAIFLAVYRDVLATDSLLPHQGSKFRRQVQELALCRRAGIAYSVVRFFYCERPRPYFLEAFRPLLFVAPVGLILLVLLIEVRYVAAVSPPFLAQIREKIHDIAAEK